MARDRTDRFTIPYSGDNPACSLLVVFAPTRTAVLETIASTEPPNNAPEISWYDHYLALQWPASWRPCSVTILVTYRGERLLHQETLWCEPGQDVQLRVQQLIECRGQQIEEQDFLDAIPGIEGSATFKRYFYDLDTRYQHTTAWQLAWRRYDRTGLQMLCAPRHHATPVGTSQVPMPAEGRGRHSNCLKITPLTVDRLPVCVAGRADQEPLRP